MKNKFGLLDSDMESILIIFNNYPQIEKAVLFGSRAKGNFKNGSDVDIAIIGEEINFYLVNQISYKLNEETRMPYKFDILNYQSIKELELKNHIDRVGIEFYKKSISNMKFVS